MHSQGLEVPCGSIWFLFGSGAVFLLCAFALGASVCDIIEDGALLYFVLILSYTRIKKTFVTPQMQLWEFDINLIDIR